MSIMEMADDISFIRQEFDNVCDNLGNMTKVLQRLCNIINEQTELLGEIKSELAAIAVYPQPASEPFIKHIHLRGE